MNLSYFSEPGGRGGGGGLQKRDGMCQTLPSQEGAGINHFLWKHTAVLSRSTHTLSQSSSSQKHLPECSTVAAVSSGDVLTFKVCLSYLDIR